LAENEESVAECASIREADLVLRVSRSVTSISDSNKTESDDADDAGDDESDAADETNNALLVRPGSPDLIATLQNTAVDEVYTALMQAWDRDHIRDLSNRLLTYLRPPVPTDIPTALRRPLPQPTL
jgi:hypothetical protein